MKKNLFLATVIILFIVYLSLNLFVPRESLLGTFGVMLYIIFPFLVSIVCFYLVKVYGVSNSHAQAFIWIGIGASCIFLGDTILFYYKYILKQFSIIGIYDFMYLPGTIFIIVGILKEVKSYQVSISKGLIIILSILLISVFGLASYFVYSAELTLLENIISIGYVLNEFIMVLMIIYLIYLIKEFHEGRLYIPWIVIAIGMFLFVVDGFLIALFIQERSNAIFPYDTLCDTFRALSVITVFYGIFLIIATINDMRNSITSKIALKKNI